MTSVGSYLHTSYIILSHNISFNCSLHVPNCSCYQSRPCKYRLLKSIRHRLIYHNSFVLSLFFSLVFSLSVVDLTLFLTGLCVSVSCIELRNCSRKFIAYRPSGAYRVCISVLFLLIVRCFFCSFLCFLFSVSLFFSFFLRKFESGRESRDGLVVILRAHMTPSLCEIESAVCAVYNCQWSELVLKG